MLAVSHQRRNAQPQCRIKALCRPVERLLRLTAGGGQQHSRVNQPALRQPFGGQIGGRQAHRHRLAAAADGGEQRLGFRAGENEAGLAGRLFERLEQGVRGDVVHAFGRVHDDHLATPARRGDLRKTDRRAHGLDLDLLARLRLRCFVGRGLVAIGQVPAQRLAQGLRQQDHQVGVRTRLHQPATGAVAARAGRTRSRLAQPGLRQRHGQVELADASRALQQQRVGTPRQQGVAQRGFQPGQGQHAVRAYHARASITAVIWRATVSRSSAASMRAKRCGAAAALAS